MPHLPPASHDGQADTQPQGTARHHQEDLRQQEHGVHWQQDKSLRQNHLPEGGALQPAAEKVPEGGDGGDDVRFNLKVHERHKQAGHRQQPAEERGGVLGAPNRPHRQQQRPRQPGQGLFRWSPQHGRRLRPQHFQAAGPGPFEPPSEGKVPEHQEGHDQHDPQDIIRSWAVPGAAVQQGGRQRHNKVLPVQEDGDAGNPVHPMQHEDARLLLRKVP